MDFGRGSKNDKAMKIQFDHDSLPYSIDLTLAGKTATVTLNGKTYNVELFRAENGNLDLRITPASSVVHSVVSSDGPKRWVTVNGQTFALTKSAGGAKRGSHSGHTSNELIAPMPGQVRAVQVAEGDSVTKGQTLVIVEAMKMEIKIAAPRDGVVKALKVRQGQTVEREQILIEMESGK